MSIPSFGEYRKNEISTKPYENLSSIEIGENEFYFSEKGSDENGNYEWESLADSSFKVVTLEDLAKNEKFIGDLIDVAIKNEVSVKDKELKVLLRDVMDETLGFDLPFTLLDTNSFNKELTYYNAKTAINT